MSEAKKNPPILKIKVRTVMSCDNKVQSILPSEGDN